jgi:hypothetical protein
MHDDMMNRSPDKHEAAMARADLYKLANYSMKLFKMIQEGQELEGWVQAKITKAADYVSSVYHFMAYEMKASDYGSKLENSDVYSESVRLAFEQKLMEAKKQAAKVKKDADKVEEGWDDMLKAAKERSGPQPSGGSGIKKGSRYGGSKQVDAPEKDDEEDEKPKKNKKVKEAAKPDYLDFDKDGNKKEPMKKALKDKKVKEVVSDSSLSAGQKAAAGQAAQQVTTSIIDPKTKKPVKMTPYDIKKSAPGGVSVGFGESSGKCNHSSKGEKCPVHGLKECGSMSEAKNLKQQAAIAIAKKKAK